MTRVSKTKLLRPFFEVASSASTAWRDYHATNELISRVLEELSTGARHLPDDAFARISAIADAFAADRSCESYSGAPGQQRQLLKALSDGGDIKTILQALAPEFLIELSIYLHPCEAEWLLDPIGEPADLISRVRAAAGRFCTEYRPATGRRVDLALETAVRALVDFTEASLGSCLCIAGNKNNGLGGPTPKCAGSRAIDMLLTGIDPATRTTSIMNMIAKVKRQPKPTDDPMLVLFNSNLIGALDASPLPGREEAIRQLRDDPVNGFA